MKFVTVVVLQHCSSGCLLTHMGSKLYNSNSHNMYVKCLCYLLLLLCLQLLFHIADAADAAAAAVAAAAATHAC